jgi:hypothetical protein
MIETLRDNLVHMLHTHDGAHVSMLCIWHGTVKVSLCNSFIEAVKMQVTQVM